MKTIKFIPALLFVMMLLILTGYSSYAIKPALAPAEHIQKMIKETIKYPAEAVKSGITGSVDVIFTVSDEGKIIIKKMSTDSKEIADEVKEQLAGICCKEVKSPYYQYYKLTITFKLV